MGRVPSAAGVDARRRDTGDAGVHRRGAVTKQMPPRRRMLDWMEKQALVSGSGEKSVQFPKPIHYPESRYSEASFYKEVQT